MKCKRIIIGILLMVFLTATVTGCNTKNSSRKKQTTNVAKGRYVEENIPMPKAVTQGKELAYILTKNAAGKPIIFSNPTSNKEDETMIQYTLKKDHTWERSIPKWLNQDGLSINNVTYAADKTMYAISQSPSKGGKYFKIDNIKSKDGTHVQKIALNNYKKPMRENSRYCPENSTILPNGNILIMCRDSCYVYKNGKIAYSWPHGGFPYVFATSKNQLMLINQTKDGVIVVDTQTGKTISQVSYPDSMDFVNLTADQKGNWYLLSEKGILRLVNGGSTWETIVDGSMASMSMPGFYFNSIITGEKDDFYVLYEVGNGMREVKHYVYDKDIPSVPGHTLSILSLEENSTIRQAVIKFQQKNRDVKVNYTALMEESTTATINDLTKKINTELLAGKGADILLLDGLPVNSYIEKGVLTDLSNLLHPMVKKHELLDHILTPYQKNGKIYTAPIRFGMLLAFGKKEAVQSTDSMQSLADYSTQFAKLPILGKRIFTYSQLTSMVLKLYSHEITGSSDIPDKNELIQFLKNLKAVSCQTKSDEKGEECYSRIPILEMESRALYHNESELCLFEINSMYDTSYPLSALKKTQVTFAPVRNEFVPHGLISINSASPQKKLAANFIRELYSYEIQKADLDGFPVNQRAYADFGLQKDNFCSRWDDWMVTQPSLKKRKEILAIGQTLTSPVLQDTRLSEMIVSETIPFLSGKADLKTTADRIMSKVATYVTE